jgi:hypothetical protein
LTSERRSPNARGWIWLGCGECDVGFTS